MLQVRRRALSGDSTCYRHILYHPDGDRHRQDRCQRVCASEAVLAVKLLKCLCLLSSSSPASLRVPQHCPGRPSLRTCPSSRISCHSPATRVEMSVPQGPRVQLRCGITLCVDALLLGPFCLLNILNVIFKCRRGVVNSVNGYRCNLCKYSYRHTFQIVLFFCILFLNLVFFETRKISLFSFSCPMKVGATGLRHQDPELLLHVTRPCSLDLVVHDAVSAL